MTRYKGEKIRKVLCVFSSNFLNLVRFILQTYTLELLPTSFKKFVKATANTELGHDPHVAHPVDLAQEILVQAHGRQSSQGGWPV